MASHNNEISKRDVMKAAGVATAGSLLAALVGCGPKWKDARAEDGLVYQDNPFYSKDSIERNLYGNIKVKEFGKPDESGQRNYRMLSLQDWKHDFAHQSGEVSKLIFVPKHVPDWFKQKIEAWESTFVPLEKEPEVYFVTRNSAVTGGEVIHAFVRHMDKEGKPDKANGLFDSSGKYETVPQYVIDQWIADGVIESMDTVGAEEVGLVENFFRVSDKTLIYSAPVKMYQRVKGKMSIFMIPNDVLGQERFRTAHGLNFIEHYTDDEGKMHLIDSGCYLVVN